MFRLKLLTSLVGVLGLSGSAAAQYPPYPVPVPAYPPAGFPPPSTPVYVTPAAPIGVNPWTGGLDTTNTQLNSSYFDPGREAARFNGTLRPVDDAAGNPVGRPTGVEWYNPATGRWNGDVRTVTPNGLGGLHDHRVGYAANPAVGRPPARPAGPPPARPAAPAPYRPR
ncbi:MAG TPA: hypothetical protein VD866_28300 [Urbifossiella sp.]|nr:hypothetical protein [Urbifossiella sp.]